MTATASHYAGRVALLLFVCFIPVNGQVAEEAPSFSCDRPGQAVPPAPVAPGYVQIEVGAQLASTDDGTLAQKTLSVPSALVRVGLTDNAELRLTGELRSVRTGSENAISGMTGAGAGLKVRITSERGLIPDLAVVATVGLPVGSASFRPQSVAPTLVIASRSTLSGPVSLYGNIGGSWDGAQGTGTGTYAALLSFTPSETVGLFAEAYGSFPPATRPLHAVDGGISYVVAPAIQVDIFAGTNITSLTDGFFVNLGVCLRLPR